MMQIKSNDTNESLLIKEVQAIAKFKVDINETKLDKPLRMTSATPKKQVDPATIITSTFALNHFRRSTEEIG